jgi:hypothetical protein
MNYSDTEASEQNDQAGLWLTKQPQPQSTQTLYLQAVGVNLAGYIRSMRKGAKFPGFDFVLFASCLLANFLENMHRNSNVC